MPIEIEKIRFSMFLGVGGVFFSSRQTMTATDRKESGGKIEKWPFSINFSMIVIHAHT